MERKVSFSLCRQTTLILCVCVLAVLAVFAAADTKNLISNLPGFGKPLESQYSGFVTIDASKNANLFYWYFESRNDPSKDPVVIWLTGGPGCSSELAILFENGPYTLDNAQLKLSKNIYSWNQKANLIFIDQPFGTGFSYANDDYVRDEATDAADMYKFLLQFFKLFPELQGRDFYITGESFAGHYVPALAKAILDGNKQAPSTSQINLKGLAIGNGWIDPYLQYAEYVTYGLENGLIDQSDAQHLNSTVARCQSLIKDKMWTLANIVCSGIMESVIGGRNINVYNIHLPCIGPLCYDLTNQTRYMNDANVQKALGVNKKWESCNDAVNAAFKTSDRLAGFQDDIAYALSSGVRALIYNGKYDLICNYDGGYATTAAIDWSGSAQWLAAPKRDYVVNGRVAGQSKSYDKLTFLAVEAAGHMVPHDQPDVALQMLNQFIAGQPFTQQVSLTEN